MDGTSDTQKAWLLTDLYPATDSPELKIDLMELETRPAALEAKRPLLTDSISQAKLLLFIGELEAHYCICRRAGRARKTGRVVKISVINFLD